MTHNPFARAASLAVAAAATAAAIGLAPSADAYGADVVPTASGGRIVTGGHDDITGEDLPTQRVFGHSFRAEPLDPYFLGDPGFNAPNGSLPPATQLLFNVPAAARSGLAANLTYWPGGAGPVRFAAATTGESIVLSLGSQSLSVAGTGTGPLAGFPIGTVTVNGGIHRHLNTFLNGPDHNNTPGDGVEPAAGIYAFAMTVASTDPSVLESDTIYMVLNNGASAADHRRAIAHVETNVIPEPASAGLVAAAGLLARRRGRPRP